MNQLGAWHSTRANCESACVVDSALGRSSRSSRHLVPYLRRSTSSPGCRWGSDDEGSAGRPRVPWANIVRCGNARAARRSGGPVMAHVGSPSERRAGRHHPPSQEAVGGRGSNLLFVDDHGAAGARAFSVAADAELFGVAASGSTSPGERTAIRDHRRAERSARPERLRTSRA